MSISPTPHVRPKAVPCLRRARPARTARKPRTRYMYTSSICYLVLRVLRDDSPHPGQVAARPTSPSRGARAMHVLPRHASSVDISAMLVRKSCRRGRPGTRSYPLPVASSSM
eukprot:scaffold3551_cov408-Prasinococcus_capsulatus_cf.AAC.31